MSGVISPTNLSLYSSPVTTSRTTPRSRWNPPFILEDDFNSMITHPVSNNNPDTSSVILMEEGKFFEIIVCIVRECVSNFSVNFYHWLCPFFCFFFLFFFSIFFIQIDISIKTVHHNRTPQWTFPMELYHVTTYP